MENQEEIREELKVEKCGSVCDSSPAALNDTATSSLPAKFKTVESLLQAYTELEAEFTRKCQTAKHIEQELERLKTVPPVVAEKLESITCQPTQEQKDSIIADYLKTLGTLNIPNVIANTNSTFNTVPASKPATLADVKSAVLAFFENKKN